MPRALRERGARFVRLVPAVLQTALAAAGAWLVATDLLGHTTPFFAPVAAIIALGTVLGERLRRAVELVLGVALGVLVADLLVIWLGSGAAQIALVVTLAMAAAIALGGTRLVVAQAATSAVLVTTVDVPDSIDLSRPLDALAGGLVAILVHLLLPIEPRRLIDRALDPLVTDAADAIDEVRAAVETGSHDGAIDALLAARELDTLTLGYSEAVEIGLETATMSPLRRRSRAEVTRHAHAAPHLELAARNVRVLARGAVRAVELEAHIPAGELDAFADLAAAFRALPAALRDEDAHESRDLALRAAARSTEALERTGNLSLSVLTGQVRFVATDLLRALGEDDADATDAVRSASLGAGLA